jgi:hypothetical protein
MAIKELKLEVAWIPIANILKIRNNKSPKIRNDRNKPSSSIVTEKIKSVSATGKNPFFWMLWPRPNPSQPPL